MTLNDVGNLFGFIGGLGLFLFGMKLMSGGLQKAAGDRMKSLLSAATDKKVKGIAVGATITAIIQSSGATTVMVVGFVNAGLMTLLQSVGVIMGANIGTTATAWLVSLDSLGESMKAFKPEFYAPLLIGIGAALVMFCKKHRKQTLGEIIISIGLLFFGLSTMSASMKPYMASDEVKSIFLTLGSNPFFGLLIGITVTGIMQSSSASIGVLQTMAAYGVVDAQTALFICLGANIGSCFTALLSCIGASKTAKQAAVINLLFNLFGGTVFGILGFIVFKTNPGIAGMTMTAVTIAIFHTSEKFLTTVLLLPLSKRLVAISNKIVRDKKKPVDVEKTVENVKHEMLLDDRMLTTPAFAIKAVSDYVVQLGKMCIENMNRGLDAVMFGEYEVLPKIYEDEKRIDMNTSDLSDFLVKLSNAGLTDKQSHLVKDLMYTTIDLERIGDHAENLADQAGKLKEIGRGFSEEGIEDLKQMREAVMGSVLNAVDARDKMSVENAETTFRFEVNVDEMEESIREKHVDRLSKNICASDLGVIFLNILTNLERVSDHAVNIAGYVKDEA